MALPMGVEVPKHAEKGHATSAPKHPYLKRKIIGTTIVALVLTTLFMYLRALGYTDLHYYFKKY